MNPRSTRFWLWLGVIAVGVQLVVYLFFVGTWLDEGLYACKGHLAATGAYRLYQDGGPWFEYMPLAFLVPGVVQAWFGPSFYAGRVFSLLCAALAVLSVYRLALRIGGRRAAVCALWLMAAGVVTLRYYVAIDPYAWTALCLVLALLALASGVRSPTREILAVFLAAVMLMTRRNMIVAWAILVLFALIVQRRWRDRAIVLAASIGFPALMMWPFWPEIRATLTAIPVVGRRLRQLTGYQPSAIVTGGKLLTFTTQYRWDAILEMVSYYVPVIVTGGLCLVWGGAQWCCRKGKWRLLQQHRITLLVGVLFLANLVIHVYGAQSFGPRNVVAYFNYLAHLGAVLGGVWISAVLFGRQTEGREPVPSGRHDDTPRGLTGPLVVLALGWGLWLLPLKAIVSYRSFDAAVLGRYSVGYAVFLLAYGACLLGGAVAVWAAISGSVRKTSSRSAPRRGALLPGAVSIGSAFAAAGLWVVARRAQAGLETVFLAALLLFVLAWGMLCARLKHPVLSAVSVGALMLASLTTGAGSFMLAERPHFPVIRRAADRLAALTAPTDRIFALAHMHAFFLAQRYPYPPLINKEYTFVVSPSDPETLLRAHRWNYALAARWLREADVIVLSHACTRYFRDYQRGRSGSGADVMDLVEDVIARDFSHVESVAEPCEGPLRVYRRRWMDPS